MANQFPVPPTSAETLAIATANGQTSFSFDWRANSADQVNVIYRPSNAPERVLVLGVDFSVQGLQNPAGGTVTLLSFSANAGDRLYMYRFTIIDREKSWQNEGDYKADLVNKEQDEIYMIMQENRRDLSHNSTAITNEINDRKAAVDQERQERIAADDALASLIGNTGSGNVPIYDTITAVSLARVHPLVNALRTNGYYYPGDGGAALYKRVTSEPSHAGKVQSDDGAWWEIAEAKLYARMLGVRADGVTNDTTAMVNCINVMEELSIPLYLPAGVIMVDPDRLVIGNGSSNGASKKNGQIIRGSASTPYFTAGTILRAAKAGQTLFRENGTLSGSEVSNITFDCNKICQRAVVTRSINECNFSNIYITNFTHYGFDIGCTAVPSGHVGWSAGCIVERLFITTSSLEPFGAGIRIAGNPSPEAPLVLSDPHRWTFIQAIVQVNKHDGGTTSALELAMTDSNTFMECDFATVGNGLGNPLVMIGTKDDNGTVYPVNNFFYGCSLQGGIVEVRGEIWDNQFINYCTRDGEIVPNHPKLRGITDRGVLFGNWSIDELNKVLIFAGDTGQDRSILFKTPDGKHQAKIFHNSSLGLEIHVYDGASFKTYARFTPEGNVLLNVDGSLKHIQMGDPDSAGSGFRSLRVPN